MLSTDPFAGDVEEGVGGVSDSNLVHIRIQQRNGRKSLTTVAGLADDLDLKRILKAFKKTFSCNGTVIEDEEHGEILQLQGDQRKNVAAFLVDNEICGKHEVRIHGF